MKVLLLIMVMTTISSSDEIHRIKEIVKDIKELRVNYAKCVKELEDNKNPSLFLDALKHNNEDEVKTYKLKIKDEKQKNDILLSEIDDLDKKNVDLDEQLNKLEKIVFKQKKELKTKDNVIISMKKNKVKNTEIKENKSNNLKNESINALALKAACKEENVFPKLAMKEKFKKKQVDESTRVFEAKAFRLRTDATIYDAINGMKLYEWEKRTSFTSNERSDGWVKITGHFVDKLWQRSQKSMWIKSEKVVQR